MPVKHYSSGMYMRLGFSVAIHVDPSILIVDEILAVGDQAFQTKCLDRIHDMKRHGVTIIMVSHNMDMVRKICSHLIWLENGKMQQIGLADEVAEQYQAHTENRDMQQMQQAESNTEFKRMGNGEIEITAVRILNKDGSENKIFKTGDELVIEMDFITHKSIPNPEFGLAIHRDDGLHINGPNTRVASLEMGVVEGPGMVRYTIPILPLMPARYLLTTAVHDSRYAYTYDYHEQAYIFRVIPGGTKEQWGAIQIPAAWEWRQDPAPRKV
ncbi:MAG: ABC transporter ATP-binding protein [Chloroflexi bacterium]|nr:ABC transporter ATP-binding protein [Chloroflexota bacterium]